MKRTTIAALLAALVFFGISLPIFAGGSREREQPTPPPEAESQQVEVRGEVVAVNEIDEESTELTIRTESGPEVIVEVPTRMARNLRIAGGDRFASEERLLARPGERLRVLNFTISRGR